MELLKKYQIENQALLKQAFTHSSLTKDQNTISNNERLEFFGDAVLKLVFSRYVFLNFPNLDEGPLTKYRARLISDEVLAKVGKRIQIESHLILGSSLQGRKIPDSVIGDAVEALIAVIYLEKGFELAEEFVLEQWHDFIELSIQESKDMDYKSSLQELIQKDYKKSPNYKILQSSGPDHDKEFEMGVYLDEKLLGRAWGANKKYAGQNAAKIALENLLKDNV